jgi:hypothetical protein
MIIGQPHTADATIGQNKNRVLLLLISLQQQQQQQQHVKWLAPQANSSLAEYIKETQHSNRRT